MKKIKTFGYKNIDFFYFCKLSYVQYDLSSCIADFIVCIHNHLTFSLYEPIHRLVTNKFRKLIDN